MTFALRPSFLVGALAVGCGAPSATSPDGGSASADLTCETNPTATSTTQVQTEVMDAMCKGCHFAGSANGLDFSSAAATQASVGHASTSYGSTLKVVEANDPVNSSSWLKILGGSPKVTGPAGQSVGGPMPPFGSSLSAAQKKTFKDWICSGAKP